MTPGAFELHSILARIMPNGSVKQGGFWKWFYNTDQGCYILLEMTMSQNNDHQNKYKTGTEDNRLNCQMAIRICIRHEVNNFFTSVLPCSLSNRRLRRCLVVSASGSLSAALICGESNELSFCI